MINRVNFIVNDSVEEKDFVIILISSLSKVQNFIITAIESIYKPKLGINYVP